MQDNDELLQFAMQLTDAAADISRRYFRQNIVIDTKSGNFPVTRADLEIESKLRQMIKDKFPRHSIIGEEYANLIGDRDEYSWVIDPIDGTVAFTTGKPTFTTLIALTKNNLPILGVIDQPIIHERFIGITGLAAYQYNASAISTSDSLISASKVVDLESRAGITPISGIDTPNGCSEIRSSTIRDLSRARLNATTPYMFTPDEMGKFTRLKNQVKVCAWGGDAYAYAMLASGYIDIIMESQLEYYDVAALIPIITASGGIITTWAGEQITPNFKGQCLASSNLELHNQVLEIIKK
jgi:inositol-phosphate phosphatase / L-galactose 1-phosphate phosphatase / histidinol-phosphatase